MAVRYFEDLEVWKLTRELTKDIYRVTRGDQFSNDYGLINQIRRASVSVMSNIAEGFERGGNKEFIRFLSIAKGSCGEVRSQLYIALDQRYIDQREFQILADKARKLSVKISNFITYLNSSQYKGAKYKSSIQPSPPKEVCELT